MLFLLALVLLAGCATPPRSDDAPTFIVVRHAEKDTAVHDDPPLIATGHARAQRLADFLRNAPLVAVYSTPYKRTRQTAAPIAAAHRLPVAEYDPREDAATFVTRLRANHPSGTVLVVGHSNTVPALTRALCGCAAADMEEATYGLRYSVTFDAAGHATLREEHDR